MENPEPLKLFAVTVEIQIAWGEMDAFKHVNNILYFRYFEIARMRYFTRIGLLDHMEKTNIGPILAETNCRFKRSISYPDTIIVGARITKLNDERFQQDYLIYSKAHQAVAAEGSGISVAFDYQENRKTKFPEHLLREIKMLEGRPIAWMENPSRSR